MWRIQFYLINTGKTIMNRLRYFCPLEKNPNKYSLQIDRVAHFWIFLVVFWHPSSYTWLEVLCEWLHESMLYGGLFPPCWIIKCMGHSLSSSWVQYIAVLFVTFWYTQDVLSTEDENDAERQTVIVGDKELKVGTRC